MINLVTINNIITSFYLKAKTDFLIGYHFRVIDDFESHIPRISQFWNLQLNGSVDKSHLPFHLIDVHRPLGIKRGEINRWMVLFKLTLNSFLEDKKISSTEFELFMKKVNHFKEIIETRLT